MPTATFGTIGSQFQNCSCCTFLCVSPSHSTDRMNNMSHCISMSIASSLSWEAPLIILRMPAKQQVFPFVKFDCPNCRQNKMRAHTGHILARCWCPLAPGGATNVDTRFEYRTERGGPRAGDGFTTPTWLQGYRNGQTGRILGYCKDDVLSLSSKKTHTILGVGHHGLIICSLFMRVPVSWCTAPWSTKSCNTTCSDVDTMLRISLIQCRICDLLLPWPPWPKKLFPWPLKSSNPKNGRQYFYCTQLSEMEDRIHKRRFSRARKNSAFAQRSCALCTYWHKESFIHLCTTPASVANEYHPGRSCSHPQEAALMCTMQSWRATEALPFALRSIRSGHFSFRSILRTKIRPARVFHRIVTEKGEIEMCQVLKCDNDFFPREEENVSILSHQNCSKESSTTTHL